jgi:hypothetical protein
MMKFWTITTANMRESADLFSKKVGVIPAFREVLVLSSEGDYLEVEFLNKKGYVYKELLEELIEVDSGDLKRNVVFIEDEVRNKTNPSSQYITVQNKTKFNLCGEFCVAYCNNVSIMSFLESWKSKSEVIYKMIVDNDKTTGISTIKNMQDVYHSNYCNFRDLLVDRVAGFLISPNRLKRLLSTHNLIVGLNINRAGQVVNSRNIGHWVCLVDVEAKGINNADVKIYNPFLNRIEIVNYRFLLESMASGTWNGAYTGLWIKKD